MLQKLLKRLGIVVIFIFFINTLATFFYWYYSIWWFDMPMHFMGGLFAILLVIFVAERYFNFRNRTAAHTALEQIIFLILVAVLVGIVWEYFVKGKKKFSELDEKLF